MFHSDCHTGGTLSQKHSTQPLLAEFTAWKQTADVGGSEEVRHKRPSGRGPVHARHCSDSSAMAVINASPPQGLCSHCFLQLFFSSPQSLCSFSAVPYNPWKCSTDKSKWGVLGPAALHVSRWGHAYAATLEVQTAISLTSVSPWPESKDRPLI